jgi:HK97 gp10 family phage protein
MLKSRIPRITAEMLPVVEAAIRAGAETIETAAKGRVPVDTGRLRDSITVVRDGELDFMVRAGNTDVFYGHIVEHGGAHTSPHPFLVPALEASRAEVIATVAAALKRIT